MYSKLKRLVSRMIMSKNHCKSCKQYQRMMKQRIYTRMSIMNDSTTILSNNQYFKACCLVLLYRQRKYDILVREKTTLLSEFRNIARSILAHLKSQSYHISSVDTININNNVCSLRTVKAVKMFTIKIFASNYIYHDILYIFTLIYFSF